MKKLTILLISILILITFTGCTKDKVDAPPPNNDSQLVEYGVAGNIADITISEGKETLGTILVEGSKDNGAMYNKAVVTITPSTKIYSNDSIDFNDLKLGMYVNVFFDGPVMESYPVQGSAKQINVIPDDPSKKSGE